MEDYQSKLWKIIRLFEFHPRVKPNAQITCPAQLQKYTVFDQQNAPEMWHRPFNPNLYKEYGDMIHFSISAMASKWGQVKISLAFCCMEHHSRSYVRELHRVIKTSHAPLRCFEDSTQIELLTTRTSRRTVSYLIPNARKQFYKRGWGSEKALKKCIHGLCKGLWTPLLYF